MDKDVKKTGYLLLGLGILIIIAGLVQTILVFTGNLRPIQLFSFTASDFAIEGSVLFPQLPSNLTDGMKVEIFPAQLINNVLNLSMNTALVFIVMMAGGKISGIGAQLLKPIVIKNKNEQIANQ